MKSITERIIKLGNTYSTCDYDPTTKDIRDILSICDPTEETIILRKGKNAMVFQEGQFVFSGEHSRIGGERFATYTEQAILDLLDEEDNDGLSCFQISKRLFPYEVLILGVDKTKLVMKALKKMKEEGWLTKTGIKWTLKQGR